MTGAIADDQIVQLTADVVSAHVSNTPVPAGEVAAAGMVVLTDI